MKRFTCSPDSPGLVRCLFCKRPASATQPGFSLIELLIAMAIAVIVAAVGLGYYGDYVTSANRTEARAALTETAGSLDKCKVLYGIYNNANCNVSLPFTTDNDFYRITGVVGATTFVLTATPVAGERQASDANCKTFTLSQTGRTGATGDDTSDCW